ncbi:hypothetical protein D047_1221A, partial [Vibrio parahaemolyticus VPTS-2010_2]
MAASYSD